MKHDYQEMILGDRSSVPFYNSAYSIMTHDFEANIFCLLYYTTIESILSRIPIKNTSISLLLSTNFVITSHLSL